MPMPTTNDIKTAAGCRVVSPVANPLLIKVATIKEKFIDQMPCHEEIPNRAKPIGTTAAWVVAKLPNGHLVKIHRSDWQKGLITGASDPRAIIEALHQVDSYPQIFET